MPSLFACPTCNASLTLDDPEAEIIRCKFCGATVVVPDDVKPEKPQPQAQPWTMNPSPQVMIQVDYGDSAFVPTGRRRGSTFWTCFGVLIFLIVLAATVIPILVTTNAIGGIFSSFGPSMSTAVSGIGGVRTSTPGGRLTVSGTRTPIPSATADGGAVANVPTANPFGAELTFGGKGTGAGLFDDARDIGIDAEGNIYVSDYTTGQIQRFDANGKFLLSWMTEKQPGPLLSMAVDRQGNVYAVRGGAIYKFEGKTGKLIRKFPDSGINYRDVTVLNDGNLLAFGYGSAISDDLVRLDANNGRVLRRFSKVVSTQTERSEPTLKVAVDGLGTIFAVSSLSYAVFKFSPEGKFINQFGSRGDSDDQFRSPDTIAVDNQSRVYISDFSGIKVFDANGRYLELIRIQGAHVFGMTFNDKNEMFIVAGNQVSKFAARGSDKQ